MLKIEPVSIHALLVQLKQGHEEMLDVLYPRYAPVFYAYARNRGLSHETAEDIVQSTFWRALDRIASYDESYGNGERWLWSICKHQVIDILRCRTTVEFSEEALLTGDIDPVAYVETQERRLAIKRAWDALAEADRIELRRGRGRGPGRKAWHEAAGRLRALYSRSEE